MPTRTDRPDSQPADKSSPIPGRVMFGVRSSQLRANLGKYSDWGLRVGVLWDV